MSETKTLTEEEILQNLKAKKEKEDALAQKQAKNQPDEPEGKAVDTSKFKAKRSKLIALRAIGDFATIMNGSLLNFNRNERISEPNLVQHLLESNKADVVIDDGAPWHKCPNCLTVFSPQPEN